MLHRLIGHPQFAFTSLSEWTLSLNIRLPKTMKRGERVDRRAGG